MLPETVSDKTDDLVTRDRIAGFLAQYVVYGGIGYIAVISIIGLYSDKQEGWKEILTITLPVIAAWVGTVLAFYFTKENFEAANRSVRDMVNQVSVRDRLKAISVKEVMINRSSIMDIKLNNDLTEDKLSLKNHIIPRFQDKVTRLPIFSEIEAVKYVVHESTVHKFVYNQITKATSADPSLKALVEDPDAGKLVKALAFVRETASLAEAQERMKQVPSCQDIFVTKGGQQEEPVLGWITNADIARQVEL
jgi:hypothetical protein